MRDAEWEALAHAVGFQSAAGRLAQPRPVPYRNATAPRPLPRTMRPADVRANDPQLAQSERDIARRELQRGDTLGRLADMGAAQSAPDPIHTPLQSNVIAGSRMVLPGAYDAGNAAGRIARGEDAWGDLALNTGMAALPFLGVRGMRGERAPAPMREPLPSQAWSAFGDLPPAEAPRPNAPPLQASDGNAASGRTGLARLPARIRNQLARPRGALDYARGRPFGGTDYGDEHLMPFSEQLDLTREDLDNGIHHQIVRTLGRATGFEWAIIRNGRRLLLTSRGNPNGAPTMFREMRPDGIEEITHYHPDSSPLSERDLGSMRVLDLSQISAIGRDGRIDLRLSPRVFGEPLQSPNANAPPPPDRTPKSLPRRKPPNGGFSMFGAPR